MLRRLARWWLNRLTDSEVRSLAGSQGVVFLLDHGERDLVLQPHVAGVVSQGVTVHPALSTSEHTNSLEVIFLDMTDDGLISKRFRRPT